MADASMAMPVWRLVACNQIPPRQLAQGVYPLKLVLRVGLVGLVERLNG